MSRLPDGFLLGCATAAHQVEGGLENDWARWVREHPELVADRSDATVAIDHAHRYRDDLRQLAELHQNAHRFSIEWARVEPLPGVIDRDALAHYREVVRSCRELGLEPVVTLHHFTLPVWVADAGGLLRADVPALFARYVAACVAALGDGVRWWLTLNEPAVLAVMSRLRAEWPPQSASLRETFAVLRTLLLMHAAAARAIREVSRQQGRPALVSLAHHERPLRPLRRHTPLDAAAALAPSWIFNSWFLSCCASGRILPPLGTGERVAGLAGSLDYIGLNHYAEDAVVLDVRSPRTLLVRQVQDPDLPRSAFGWSIDPQSLRRALQRLWARHRLPLLVTENGVSDHHDELRPRFIVENLRAVCEALASGVDVRGYLHWTAWDNFEWNAGYTQRFGIIAVDRATLRRTLKPSAELYAQICRTGEVPESV